MSETRKTTLYPEAAGSTRRHGPAAALRLCSLVALVAVALVGACGESRERSEGGASDGVAASTTRSAEQGERAESGELFEPTVAVAITIDDLPWVGPLPPGWDRLEGTRRIMAALGAHAAPAAGFVNCGRVSAGTPVLRLWLETGHELGNHTEHHLDLNRADPAEWAAEVRSCDRFLRELTGESSLTFRYPYLHRGPTVARYQAGRDVISELGSVIAPVSIDTGDWLLDDAYVEALRAEDEVRAEAIATAYVEHVVRAAAHYREVAGERVGREVAHVLLLHANALAADRLEPLLDRLAGDGFRFVSLAEALRDPVYDQEDDYIGPEGLSWLYRIPPATPEAQAWDDAEAEELRRLVR